MTARRSTIVVVVTVALTLGGLAQFIVSRQHDERIRREIQAKAQTLKDHIDRTFPVGTHRAFFMEFADRWPRWHANSGNDHFMSVGEVPSGVWYCGPWDVVVVVSFTHDRLSATKISSLGLNCP